MYIMNNVSSTSTIGIPAGINVTNETKEEHLPEAAVAIISTVWSLIILTGVIGNGLVIYIVFRYGERSITNVYITNLAFADLTFIFFVVPATLLHIVVPTWILGDAYCKFSSYMIYVSIAFTNTFKVMLI